MANAHKLVKQDPNQNIANFRSGDTVKVNFKIKEGEKFRIQPFQGVVVREGGNGPAASFTVRRVAFEVGIERTFLYKSPLVESVGIIRHGDVRRTNLQYLRELSGKAARVKERKMVAGATAAAPAQVAAATSTPAST
ncbi:MAG: 50S ribosomal protein L19 [Dehalococcoidia bacterium]|nr:50S ribosomal protein L19 [Dehalococcoidia bacterium]